MDDTLYKERDYRTSGWRAVARCFAAVCRMTPDELYSAMTESPARAFETVCEIAARNGVEVSVDMQLNIYRAHRPEISLDEESRMVLSELRARGINTGIITDGRALGQLNKLAVLEADRYIDPQFIIPTVLFNTDKHSDKPFKVMEEILRKKGVTSFVYVGDNLAKDFIHPNQMGWATVMLRDTDGVNIHPQDSADWPVANHPRLVIDSLAELKAMV